MKQNFINNVNWYKSNYNIFVFARNLRLYLKQNSKKKGKVKNTLIPPSFLPAGVRGSTLLGGVEFNLPKGLVRDLKPPGLTRLGIPRKGAVKKSKCYTKANVSMVKTEIII